MPNGSLVKTSGVNVECDAPVDITRFWKRTGRWQWSADDHRTKFLSRCSYRVQQQHEIPPCFSTRSDLQGYHQHVEHHHELHALPCGLSLDPVHAWVGCLAPMEPINRTSSPLHNAKTCKVDAVWVWPRPCGGCRSHVGGEPPLGLQAAHDCVPSNRNSRKGNDQHL